MPIYNGYDQKEGSDVGDGPFQNSGITMMTEYDNTPVRKNSQNRLVEGLELESKLKHLNRLRLRQELDKEQKQLHPLPNIDDADNLINEEQRFRKPTLSEYELGNIPRLVHRNLPYHQSKQKIAVTNKTIFGSLKLQYILSHDWYHVILRFPTHFSLFCLLSVWTLAILIFAAIYKHIDEQKPDEECGLGTAGKPINFPAAFAFSLETCTTVGYGLPNSTNGYFEPQCNQLQAAIYFQMLWSMLFNAFLFAFIFARLARCEQRGAQVMFSDKAIIEIRDDKWFLHIRVYDMDAAQPVVQAHVRMYCVSWRDYERQTRELIQPHLLHEMRIIHPDDELGASMFTSIPANVTHCIDKFSPLTPPKLRKKVNSLDGNGLVLREVDSEVGHRDSIPCPVCGETFSSFELLERHIAYSKLIENAEDNFPIFGSHSDTSLLWPKHIKPFQLKELDIREQLMDKEIMCVLEGIEPMVSGSFQALQSYKLEDIVFGGRFSPCMSQQNGRIFVDIDKFHEIIPPDESSQHIYDRWNKGQ